ncbi:EaD [Salmonella enterica subsp. enterica]|uniref:EaD n=1 Tax=Salmonella enterica I TaxID=59201 RepID=A0A379W4R9_SALET|nr:EaD [Salmonella enterica subsp. enterica]
MSNIDKQVLREEFRYMQDHYNDPADRKRQEIYIAAEALLDELDKKTAIHQTPRPGERGYCANGREAAS